MYKIVNNLVDIPSTLLIPAYARTRGNTVFKTIYTRSDAYKYSYFPHTIITWSYIPQVLWRSPPSTSSVQGWGHLPSLCSPRCKYFVKF